MAKFEPFQAVDSISALLSMQEMQTEGAVEQYRELDQYIVVLLGREQIAIPITGLKEIIEVPNITELPNVPEYILGICSVRGDITSVTDIRMLLDIPPSDKKTRQEAKKERVVILEGEKYITGIIVDTVVEVLSLSKDEIEDAGKTLRGRLGEFCDGIYTEGGRLLAIMNVELLLNSMELSQFN